MLAEVKSGAAAVMKDGALTPCSAAKAAGALG
jgi:hypothetical protein